MPCAPPTTPPPQGDKPKGESVGLEATGTVIAYSPGVRRVVLIYMQIGRDTHNVVFVVIPEVVLIGAKALAAETDTLWIEYRQLMVLHG